MQFRLLGPVQLATGDRIIEVGPAKQRCVLAALLWAQGDPVPVEMLIDRVWGEDLPEQVHNALYSYIARLRQILRKATGDTVHIARTPHGYLLRVPEEQVDLTQYQHLVQVAREAGDPATAAAHFHRAIQIWRDVPLAGIAGDWAARARAALEQQHLGVLADWAQAEIVAGRPGQAIDTLLTTRERYPFAEPPVRQLMIALSRTGRSEEALATFRDYRELLAQERGLDPGSDLRELEVLILRGELPGPTPAHPVPRHLPPVTSHFTGRVAELDSLDAPSAAIWVIAGAGGVGKTTLALRWAHQAATRFPDGQLYVNLNGYGSGEPVSADAALDGFLRALGVAATAIPPKLDERTALFRSLLADRKTLVVLDNARAAGQVRPLLPGNGACHVVITSRDGLAGLVAREGAQRITLDVLPGDDAQLLLGHLLGQGRIEADRSSTERLIRLCDGLPLALRIAAERAARHPQAPLGDLVTQLSDHARRLDLLDAFGDADAAIRAVLSWSYHALAADAARLFRLMGLHTCPALGLEAIACLMDLEPHEAARVIDDLERLHLVQQDSAGHFRMHDLTRAYASELAVLDDQISVSDLDRLLLWYLHACHVASMALSPESATPLDGVPAKAVLPRLSDGDAALAWFDRELANLVAAVRDSARHQRHRLTWQVARNLFGYCHRRKRWDEWAETYRHGLAAATVTENLTAQAAMHNGLGVVAKQHGDLDEALVCYNQSLEAARRIGHERLIGCALVNLSGVHIIVGNFDLAQGCLHEAARTPSYGENPAFACITFYNLGCALIEKGDYAGAEVALRRSLAFAEESGHQHQLTYAHHSLGEVALLQGNLIEATRLARQAIGLAEQAGDRLRYARSLDLLGSCLAGIDPGEATRHWREASTIAAELGHPFAGEMHRWLNVVAESAEADTHVLNTDHRQRARRLP